MQTIGLLNSVSDFYVGFSSDTDLFFLKFLKRGFRHCFLFFGDEFQTFVLDPVSNKIELSLLPFGVEKTKKMFEQKQISVIKVCKNYKPKMKVKTGIFTCVEVVKRVLGISNFFILTPFRLYCFLQK